MARTIKVIPAEGVIVRDDRTATIVPEEGKLVEESIYWLRRARAGDVTIEEVSEAPTAAPQPAPVAEGEV